MRKVTIEEAVREIEDGASIVMGQAAVTADLFTDELVRQRESHRGLKLFHLIHLGRQDHLAPDMADCVEVRTMFVYGREMVQAVAERRAQYIPCHFSDLPGFMGDTIPVDWAVVQVTPPDRMGRYSLSVGCDYAQPAVRKAKRVFAIVNDQLPFVYGNNFVTRDQIDLFVEHSQPPFCVRPKAPTELEEAIADICTKYIPDGATLQAGIGGIPDAVLARLTGRRDLGIHTELLTPGVQKLYEAGAITGAKKGHRTGKIIATMALGDRAFYDWLDHNEEVELYPADVVNDFDEIAANDRMISINSAVEVDLRGQVNAEMIVGRMYSGSGGQVDFVRGASRSRGGHSILALPSTAKGGTVSRIVPRLGSSSIVTTLRNDVDIIATEYGAVELCGLTERDRAKALISIAHPKFREELEAQWAAIL